MLILRSNKVARDVRGVLCLVFDCIFQNWKWPCDTPKLNLCFFYRGVSVPCRVRKIYKPVRAPGFAQDADVVNVPATSLASTPRYPAILMSRLPGVAINKGATVDLNSLANLIWICMFIVQTVCAHVLRTGKKVHDFETENRCRIIFVSWKES